MGNLYALSNEYLEIADRLEELEASAELDADALAAQLWESLKIVEDESERKVASLVRWRENEQAQADALAEEIRILQRKKKAAENRADTIKRFLADFMRTIGVEKFDAGVRKLSFRKGSKSLEVIPAEIDNWPAEIYDRAIESGAIKLCYEVKKTLIKELDGYLALPGVYEVEGDASLMIR